MQPQPIANFEQRMNEYREEMRNFLLRECTWMLLICVLVSVGMMYLFAHFSFLGIQLPADLDWLSLGVITGGALMIPPFLMMKPRRPEPGDVKADQALRRAMGMDDSVSR